MSLKSTLGTVQGLKESLSKEVEKGDDQLDEDSCRDIMEQLDACPMSMQVLSTSLIGTVVSKLKKHDQLGPQAKGLIKKWKQVAKDADTSNSNNANNNNSSSSKQAKRRASEQSTGSVDAEEWNDLPPQRHSICKKLHESLGVHKKKLVKSGINGQAVDHLLVSRASEVEHATDHQFQNDKNAYVTKARSLCFNLKKNVNLAEQVILGQVSADELVGMSSEELASDKAKKEREETTRKVSDSKRLDWDQANEDKINEMCGIRGDLLKASLFTCGRCKSVKTTSTQKQTRSADEPMTVFVFCLNCGKRWKC